MKLKCNICGATKGFKSVGNGTIVCKKCNNIAYQDILIPKSYESTNLPIYLESRRKNVEEKYNVYQKALKESEFGNGLENDILGFIKVVFSAILSAILLFLSFFIAISSIGGIGYILQKIGFGLEYVNKCFLNYFIGSGGCVKHIIVLYIILGSICSAITIYKIIDSITEVKVYYQDYIEEKSNFIRCLRAEEEKKKYQ